jgi:hypothetical protein
MAHLWRRETNEDRWAVIPLESDGIALSPLRRRLTPARRGEKLIDAVVLLPVTEARGDGWVLITATGAEVGINGLPLMSGIRVLSDRDEISIGGRGSYFFSTETLATIEPFASAERRLFCPRCKDELAPGDASVKCPQCRLIHHQSDDRPCWIYAETCAGCSQRSDLQSGYRWTPEAI